MVRRLTKGHKMEIFTLSNPDAAAAVFLAHKADDMPRAELTRILQSGQVKRSLYILARILRAAGNVHTVKN
jgi:hypothetical protein